MGRERVLAVAMVWPSHAYETTYMWEREVAQLEELTFGGVRRWRRQRRWNVGHASRYASANGEVCLRCVAALESRGVTCMNFDEVVRRSVSHIFGRVTAAGSLGDDCHWLETACEKWIGMNALTKASRMMVTYGSPSTR